MGASDHSLVAIITARGGSKGLPGKNLLELAGKPLLCHTIDAALECGSITRVVVSTEDFKIAEVARAAGALVIDRPPELMLPAGKEDFAFRSRVLLSTCGPFESRLSEMRLLSPSLGDIRSRHLALPA